MKSKDYIINKIDELISLFPTTKVSYYIDEFSNSNYVKVLPSDEYNNNEDCQKFETNFIVDFINKYPYDEIVFISKNNLIDLCEPFYEVEGKLFSSIETFCNTDIWSNDFKIEFNLTLDKSVNEIVGNYNSLSDIVNSFNENTSINPIPIEPTVGQVEDNSCVLAA